MGKYRKNPVVIEAFRLGHENIPDWFMDRITDKSVVTHKQDYDGPFGVCADIETLEGTMHASAGDWIIRGVNGEIYPCKPDIFKKTYEAVE